MNGLIASGGFLYGTTSSGGASGNGAVFQINPKNGAETILYNFAGGADGSGPQGNLVADGAGNLYGTTAAGGASGAGTVFKIAGTKETVLHSFAGGPDGADPVAGLTFDAAGNLYGTTSGGGTSSNGTVFELAAPQNAGSWTESVLYSFGTGTDGAVPVGGVTFDAAGNLYGTTSAGGAYNLGTVFQLVPGSGWTENILHNFEDANDGSVPYAGLVADAFGNFYGAATQGGQGGQDGGGTIYELTSSGGNWTFTPLYGVPGWGISGSFRNVVLDASGNIYATTHCDGDYGAGTVYELKRSGGSFTYELLYNFKGEKDGLYSFSNLVLSNGKLYGTTKYGGKDGSGVVFQVTP
jgi:uncharacterized repeat protein (TIGR03803 family)